MPEKLLKQALQKIAQYLSFRSHSEKELRQKLSKNFSANLIEKSLELAKQKSWLEEPLEIAKKTAKKLHQKNKSWAYIKKYLQEKSLPLPEYDENKEKEKLKRILTKKQFKLTELSYKEKLQIKQFLAYRSFEPHIVEELLKELLKTNSV